MAQQPSSSSTNDLYSRITDQLIAEIEKNPGDPQLPWSTDGTPLHLPRNALTNSPYSGINTIQLWASAMRAGFTQPLWGTYKQWAELGGRVRRGEKGSPVIFYKQYDREPSPDDPADDGHRRVVRAFVVFNADQVTGYTLPDAKSGPKPGTSGTSTPLPDQQASPSHSAADQVIANTRADIRYGGDRAFYNREDDFIQMPAKERFTGTSTMPAKEALYATLLHELAHWTGAAHRLNRDFGQRFGDQRYAMEELVAEIGAAFMCAELAVTPSTRADHAQYVANWLQILLNDKRAIFIAAARASEATRFVLETGRTQ